MSPSDGHAAQLLRDVALDISALHDPDLTLTGLVRRVRAAIGCELAYLSLNDAQTRHTQIEFSDGIRTTEYATIRMPIGTGVLGMAAAGVTTETPDYLSDVAKFHIDSVDAAVHAEGVRAILGTPLRVGGEVVGTITVANRTAGGFSESARGILAEAALIGSVAVDVYLLRRRIESQESAFRAEVQQLSSSAAEESLQLHLSDEFSAALAAGMGITELLAIASRAVRGEVSLGEGSAEAPASPHSLTVPLNAGGTLEIQSTDSARVATLSTTIARFVSVAVLYERAIEDARHLREHELVERLVDPRPDSTGQPVRTGLPGSGPLSVSVAQILNPNHRRAALTAIRNTMGRDAIAAERRGDLVVIARESTEQHDRLSRALAPFDYFGGVVSAIKDSGIAAAFDEASLVSRSMRSLRRPSQLAAREDLGVIAFAIGSASQSAHGYIAAHLGPVLSGATRDARLRETARLYLDAQGSVSHVATELAVHENTVRQRLERLDLLLGEWRSGPHSLDVHVALRAQALLEAERSGS